MGLPVAASLALVVAMLITGAAPTVPPASDVTVSLPDRAYLHMSALPLGRLDGKFRVLALHHPPDPAPGAAGTR